MSSDNQLVSQYNREVRTWSKRPMVLMKNNIRLMSSKGKGELLRYLMTKTRSSFGEIDTVTYPFPKHGIYFHYGVGRGYRMQNGKVVRVAVSEPTTWRKSKDWLNSPFDIHLPYLVDIVTKYRGDKAVNAIGSFVTRKNYQHLKT